MLRKSVSSIICSIFTITAFVPPGYAQPAGPVGLPAAGAMVSTSQPFVPVLLKGMTLHPENPFEFDFIVDSGNAALDAGGLKDESERLVKYFLASMTIPATELWVNLSPYEEDRIIPETLSQTQLGRDLLAQDYLLKQLTASLMHPESGWGAGFWEKVYARAREKYGTTDVPVNTFNKIWILPGSATVYEHRDTVYIVESRLKVMLDADYQARPGARRSEVRTTNRVNSTPRSSAR